MKAEYKLHGHIIANVSSAKYVGVTTTEDLKWDTHIWNICNKANRTIGFLRRNLSIGAFAIKQQTYFTLVRPLIEYASTVWDPHTQVNIWRLEIVQRRAARYVTNRQRNTSSVSTMLHSLHMWTLQDRRKDARLGTMYRIDRGLVSISKDKRLLPPKRKMRLSHKRAFQLITCCKDRGKMSSFPQTVRDWNALPPDIANLETLEAFKVKVSVLEY